MDPLPTDSEEISIRCPGCGQRFTVGQELVGRVVECGSCDRRFRVVEEVMLRSRKFYPGEHRDPSLEHFGRVPMRSAMPPSFEQAYYQSEAPSPTSLEPTSPKRIIFGAVGVLLAVLVALILMFGGGPGGVLDGASVGKRLTLAVFTGGVTLGLLLMANPHGRLKGGLVGALIAIGLIALPFGFRQGVDVPGSDLGTVPGAIPADGSEEPEGGGEAPDRFAALKEEMAYEPLEKALSEYGPDGLTGGKTAVGIWLRDLRDYNKKQVLDFLRRKTGAADSSWIYPRDRGDFLLVLRDVDPGLEHIAKLCERFGRRERKIEELRVVEVVVDNESFIQGDLSKLQDTGSPAFYSLNKRELDSIDLERARAAVVRLASAEPKLYRVDIVRRMQELLAEGDTELKREIAKALAVWAGQEDGSVEAIRKVAGELLETEGTVPRPVIAFLVKSKDPGAIPILHELWVDDSKDWETLYGDLGPMIEERVLEQLDDAGASLKHSAVRLLGRVGSSKSLPRLQSELATANSELRVLLEKSIRSIRSRG